MIVAMDLNASPVPEEDEDTFEGHVVEEYHAPEERVETAVDIARRVPFPLIFYFFPPSFSVSWWSMLAIVIDALDNYDGTCECLIYWGEKTVKHLFVDDFHLVWL